MKFLFGQKLVLDQSGPVFSSFSGSGLVFWIFPLANFYPIWMTIISKFIYKLALHDYWFKPILFLLDFKIQIQTHISTCRNAKTCTHIHKNPYLWQLFEMFLVSRVTRGTH